MALTADSLLPWLQKNKDLLNLAHLATEAHLAQDTLRSAVRGGRKLTPEAAEKLLTVLREAFKDLFAPTPAENMQKLGNAILAAKQLGQL